MKLLEKKTESKKHTLASIKVSKKETKKKKKRGLLLLRKACAAVKDTANIAMAKLSIGVFRVALKVLIVVHRNLREGDLTFREELWVHSQRNGNILQLSNFKDDSSPIGWVSNYALFLEERLKCLRILEYDIEAEPPGKDYSRTSDPEYILERLRALQDLLHRLVGCRPKEATMGTDLIHYGLDLVLKESSNIYSAIEEEIPNLVYKFSLTRRKEVFDICSKADQQRKDLCDFSEACRGLQLARHFHFPILSESSKTSLEILKDFTEAAGAISVPMQLAKVSAHVADVSAHVATEWDTIEQATGNEEVLDTDTQDPSARTCEGVKSRGSADRRRLESLRSRPDRPREEIRPRRKRNLWNAKEVETLEKGVREFGAGQWKQILDKYKGDFCERTRVDLKDKWRNMERKKTLK